MLETGHILSQKYFEIFHYLRMVLWNSIFRCRLFSGIVLKSNFIKKDYLQDFKPIKWNVS